MWVWTWTCCRDLCIQPQRPLRIMARGAQRMGENAQQEAMSHFHPFPRRPLSLGPKQSLGQNLHFQSPKPVGLDCVFKQDFLSFLFFFNWKEALNTLKVASGTSSQHALHLLLFRQASLQPHCKLCFQLQKLVWTRAVTEAVQTGFCNWKGGKTKDF